MPAPKILAFAGSARTASFNKQLIKIAVQGARDAGAEVTLIDLRDYPLPLFDQDLEASSGIPENGLKLKKLFLENDGLLIASPECNSSFSPLFKNTIDWVSRSSPGEAGLAAFNGKVATIMSASPGALGGLRGLVHVRALLGNINVIVLPSQIAVPKASEAFEADGKLKDAKLSDSVAGLGRKLTEFLAKLKG